jgi:hypothetical protein
MSWIRWILAYLFGCVHRHTTWPHCDCRGLDYVCCLDCGRELPYSTRRMSIVTEEKQLEDRTFDAWGFGKPECTVKAKVLPEGVRAL